MNEKQQLIEYWKLSGIIKDSSRVIKAFMNVPREKFIHIEQKEQAYGDYPLPIQCDQTISQPTTVMIMLEALNLKKTDKVLEIGAGSGYNAALISKLAKFVYSIEYHKELFEYAKKNIANLKITNAKIIQGDGSVGLKEKAPFDAIIMTAAAPKIPEILLSQLKDGGRLIAPIGNLNSQEMILITKQKDKLKKENLGGFMFVPLKGKHGF